MLYCISKHCTFYDCPYDCSTSGFHPALPIIGFTCHFTWEVCKRLSSAPRLHECWLNLLIVCSLSWIRWSLSRSWIRWNQCLITVPSPPLTRRPGALFSCIRDGGRVLDSVPCSGWGDRLPGSTAYGPIFRGAS